jgi:hypothetical protein
MAAFLKSPRGSKERLRWSQYPGGTASHDALCPGNADAMTGRFLDANENIIKVLDRADEILNQNQCVTAPRR